MVDSKDPLQVAKAEALHPSGATAALEALNHGAYGAIQVETGVQPGSHLARLTEADQRVHQSVL